MRPASGAKVPAGHAVQASPLRLPTAPSPAPNVPGAQASQAEASTPVANVPGAHAAQAFASTETSAEASAEEEAKW